LEEAILLKFLVFYNVEQTQMITIKSMKNILSGALFLSVGVAAALGSRRYAMGRSAAMGPGYFPFYLGWLLAGLGLLVLFTGLSRGDGHPEVRQSNAIKFSVVAPTLVLGAVIIFAMTLNTVGLIGATTLAVILSSLGSGEFRIKEVVLYAIGLAVLVWVIFALGLQVTMPIWPVWIGR
jgi:hypothetical protein